MRPPSDHEKAFVDYLQGLVAQENRAALAALRRGLGKRPGAAPEMFPYVVPWLPAEVSAWDEEAFYLVGAAFAAHQIAWPAEGTPAGPTNLGASFARLAKQMESASVERRFVAMLNCRREDLPAHLRHAVSLLRAREVPIDWARLLRDIRRWQRPDRGVQREWAAAFWAADPAATPPTAPTGSAPAETAAAAAQGQD